MTRRVVTTTRRLPSTTSWERGSPPACSSPVRQTRPSLITRFNAVERGFLVIEEDGFDPGDWLYQKNDDLMTLDGMSEHDFDNDRCARTGQRQLHVRTPVIPTSEPWSLLSGDLLRLSTRLPPDVRSGVCEAQRSPPVPTPAGFRSYARISLAWLSRGARSSLSMLVCPCARVGSGPAPRTCDSATLDDDGAAP